jgi:7-carboxy-7-deazaguanine synthase
MEIGQILERVKSLQCGMVEVTGGEPLIQPETPLLITKLLGEGLTVLLETNGSIDIGALDPRCVRIVDIKCPSSGMAEENELRNLEKLTPQDELKFVLGNRADYEFSRDLLTSFPSLPCKKNFSPVFGSLDPRTLAEWILEDHLPVRLNLQIHKIVKLP